MKHIFALRLRQFAKELYSIKEAISRINDGEYGENDSPSSYTPSMNESRERLEKLSGTIHGYTLAVDDALDLDHGTTENNFYKAIEQGAHIPENYEEPDQDSGYASDIALRSESQADEVFERALFEN